MFWTLPFPIINGAYQSIWQSKVEPDVQGRVFAARGTVAQLLTPAALLLAGWLPDTIFEPAMRPDGFLAPALGWLVGTGPGAGMGLAFVMAGVLGALTALAGYLSYEVRNIEDILPDHNAGITPVMDDKGF